MLSLPVGTEMFHFPTFPPLTLCVQVRVTGHDSCRVSPFGNPRITARLAAPRGFSQPPTSFFGSWCQGIHRAPLLTWLQSLMLASTVQFSSDGRDSGPEVTACPVPAKRAPGRSVTGLALPPGTVLSRQAPCGRPEVTGRRETSGPSGPNSVPRRELRPSPRSVPASRLY